MRISSMTELCSGQSYECLSINLNKFYFYFSVGGLMVEKPKLDSNSKVIGWDVSWSPQRPFALGMKNAVKN